MGILFRLVCVFTVPGKRLWIIIVNGNYRSFLTKTCETGIWTTSPHSQARIMWLHQLYAYQVIRQDLRDHYIMPNEIALEIWGSCLIFLNFLCTMINITVEDS